MTFFNNLTFTELMLSANPNSNKFLRMLYLKKQFFMLFFRRYKVKKNTLFRKHHSYIYITLLKKNLFITVCNDLQQRKYTYTLGMDKLKNKKSRFSKNTIRLIRKRLSHVLKINKFIHFTVFYKGRKHKVRKYAKFFSKYLFYMSSLVFFLRVSPHGGCRPSKKKRR